MQSTSYSIPLFSILLLTSCATPHLTEANVRVVAALPWQPGDTGFYFDNQNKALLESEGIPSSYFASTPRGWYMTQAQEIAAANIRAGKRNPQIWVP